MEIDLYILSGLLCACVCVRARACVCVCVLTDRYGIPDGRVTDIILCRPCSFTIDFATRNDLHNTNILNSKNNEFLRIKHSNMQS
jgi:hypothetical protein